ncbi:protein of unknown function [Candidatus Filomicrobium marinum]|uniref:Uncharacterized protein n=1 Tax=Candidatus Filomicrobium marinum TaxID=1608628 RepID=A0A0D6JED0_9HYPH|nr:protein of unknown function [Candidatus Filomicrobium marinum]CPR18596.1 protein of unknown function [Candidatus Filomicrobium marinum]
MMRIPIRVSGSSQTRITKPESVPGLFRDRPGVVVRSFALCLIFDRLKNARRALKYGAGEENRTPDIQLGKLSFYH